MLAFIYNFSLFLAASTGGESGAMRTYNEIFNYPGFELWKFVNVAIFVAILLYMTKKPLSEAFKAKRDQIRAELILAEEEKNAALAKLAAAEAKLAELETEKAEILKWEKSDSEAEKARLAEQTAIEIERMRLQSESELARLSAQTFAGLRRFSAEESIRLAEEKLRAQIDGEMDERLVRSSISEIGGLN